MSGFIVGLWESVFQPGTSPQLILATHLSFIALLTTLSWLIYVTKGNIHFIMLFIIALLLWITIIWFISELETAKLMSNEELEVNTENADNDKKTVNSKATTTALKKSASTSTKSRKA